jgi:hypothetical protein
MMAELKALLKADHEEITARQERMAVMKASLEEMKSIPEHEEEAAMETVRA